MVNIRKVIVVLAVAAVALTAGISGVARWLQEVGAVELAQRIRAEYLTGTALAVITALLLVVPGGRAPRAPGSEERGDRWPFA